MLYSRHAPTQRRNQYLEQKKVEERTHNTVMHSNITQIERILVIVSPQYARNVTAYEITKRPGEVVVLVHFVSHLLEGDPTSIVRENAC